MTAKAIIRAVFLAGVPWLPLYAAAGPMAAIDTLEVSFGTVYEKNVTHLTHTFNIRNTGDSTLRFYNIRHSCGCTTFRSDSVVLPGKVGHITMQLDLSRLEDGAFDKDLNVSTNDRRCPKVRFRFSGVYRRIIWTDGLSIILPTPDKKDTTQTVMLYTEKPDLKVTKVSFAPDDLPSTQWLPTVPIKFMFRKTGKKNAAGQRAYSLQIYYSVTRKSLFGTFVVATNHPDRPEIRIMGVLNPVEQP
jgi:hypothetical protein